MKQENLQKGSFWRRLVIYAAGLIILAFGITLNTKTGLGVSPIVSVAYGISVIWNQNLGNITLIQYSVFVIVEILLHLLKKEQFTSQQKTGIGRILLFDLLQIPLSVVFTRFINLFSVYLPELTDFPEGHPAGSLPVRLLVLAAAIFATGIGAYLSLNMRLIPNPGDGIVQTLSDFFGKSLGLTKNCFDLLQICITLGISLLCAGRIVGIGIGTLAAVLGVGRVIALMNHIVSKERSK